MAGDAFADALRGKRILITGVAGFVGQRLAARLAGAGLEFVGTYHRMQPPEKNGGTWKRVDITDGNAVRSLVRETRPQIVFHLAARLGAERSYDFAEQAIAVNFLGTHSLITALGRGVPEVERLILLGSSEEYGMNDALPYTEEMPARPVSPYSASKAAATHFAVLYHELFELPVVVLRPFIIYGPGQPPGMMLPSLIRAALADEEFPMTPGEQTRDFIHVDDVVACLLAAAIEPGAIGEIFNVCSGEEHTILDVAERVVKMVGRGRLRPGALPYRQNELWRLVGSREKAERLLGWAPRIGLDEGLGRTIEWYRLKSTD